MVICLLVSTDNDVPPHSYQVPVVNISQLSSAILNHLLKLYMESQATLLQVPFTCLQPLLHITTLTYL